MTTRTLVSYAFDEELPVIDLSGFLSGANGALESTAALVRHALERIGFFFIVGHRIPWSLRDKTIKLSADFHALDEEAKLPLRFDESFVGYMPNRGELPTTSVYSTGTKKADVGEAFFIRRDWGGANTATTNRWPEKPDGFREMAIEYYEAVDDLAHRMLPLYAVALDLPADYFSDKFDFQRDLSILRLAHMPPGELEEDEFNVGPHTDSSFMTLLATSDHPGLQILTRSGRWLKAPVISGAFCVNSGDILTRWSNGRVLSTPHRVINESGEHRYSIPLFLQPPDDTMIECLPTCCSLSNPVKEAPITAGAYLRWFLDANFAIGGKTFDRVEATT
jgi:isopenicillin N synthase-like dioxygenase